MSLGPFVGSGEHKPAGASLIPPRQSAHDIDPATYVADAALVDAVNIALLLQQPLLLTGEPGTGKTQLAYRVAWELSLEGPFKFETKSTSQSRDLFYTYDALGRFQAKDSGASVDVMSFINFGPLGRATLLASDDPADRRLLGVDQPTARQSLVLIDEIDKAPRDFPNDILNEIELQYFRIAELGNREIRAPRARRPVVVITSNSERDLPDAFLRRCVFYHIEFPDLDPLKRIVEERLGASVAATPFLKDALDLFHAMRKGGLRKKPATAELIGWLIALRSRTSDGRNPLSDRTEVLGTLPALIKTVEDKDEAHRIVEAWFKGKR